MSHRDLVRYFLRLVSRARIGLAMSQGITPRPRLMLPLPLPVGMSSEGDLLVLDLAEPRLPDETLADLAGRSHPDVPVISARSGGASLPFLARHRVAAAASREAVDRVLAADHLGADREGRAVDLRPGIAGIRPGPPIEIDLIYRSAGGPRVSEVLSLLGIGGLPPVVRCGVEPWKEEPCSACS